MYHEYIVQLLWLYHSLRRWRYDFACTTSFFCKILYLFKQYFEKMFCKYTGCPRRNGQNFGRVFPMLNYNDITQNTYIRSWTVTEIMPIEKCGLLGCPRTVRRPWRHTRPVPMSGNQTPLASIVMQWPWRDNASAAACVNYLET